MEAKVEIIIAKPRTLTKDMRVIATAPRWWGERLYRYDSEEYWVEYRKYLEGWTRDFESFLRDHRSQDLIGLDIEADTALCCSACRGLWEPYTEGDCTYCSHCGATVETTK